MKRLLLATAAVFALGTPAFAQTAIETTVSEALMTRGYSAEGIASLTDAQVTELYLALTSEDDAQIQTVIAGFGLPNDTSSDLFAASGGEEQTRAAVAEVLTTAGYPDTLLDMLSSEQIAQIYLSSTSEDASDVTMTLEEIGVDEMMASAGNTEETDAGMYVTAELERRGVSAEDIAKLDDSDISELYIVLTSGDETAIREAIASATAS